MKFAVGAGVAQIFQAACSFFGNLAFLWVLDPSRFGLYAAALSLAMIIIAANRVVFAEQLLISGAHRYGYRDFAFCLGALLLTFVGATAFISGDLLLSVCLVYLSLYVLSDALRFLAFAEGEKGMRRVLISDALRASLLAVAWVASVAGGPHVALVLALLASLVHPVYSATFAGNLSVRRVRWFLSRASRYEAAMSLQFAIGTAGSQLLPFAALAILGSVAYGFLRAAQSLAAPVGLLASVASPAAYRWLTSVSGTLQLRRFAVIALLAVPVAGVIGTAVVVVLHWVGPRLVPVGSWSGIEPLLAPSVWIGIVVLVALPGGVLLRVRRLGGVGLRGQLVGMTATVGLAIIALQQGIVQFAWALTVGAAVTVLSTYLLLALGIRRDQSRG